MRTINNDKIDLTGDFDEIDGASNLTSKVEKFFNKTQKGKMVMNDGCLHDQCDQMTRLCFQYLAIFSNKNLPKSIQIVPKWAENFAQSQINLK